MFMTSYSQAAPLGVAEEGRRSLSSLACIVAPRATRGDPIDVSATMAFAPMVSRGSGRRCAWSPLATAIGLSALPRKLAEHLFELVRLWPPNPVAAVVELIGVVIRGSGPSADPTATFAFLAGIHVGQPPRHLGREVMSCFALSSKVRIWHHWRYIRR